MCVKKQFSRIKIKKIRCIFKKRATEKFHPSQKAAKKKNHREKQTIHLNRACIQHQKIYERIQRKKKIKTSNFHISQTHLSHSFSERENSEIDWMNIGWWTFEEILLLIV